MLSLYNTYCRAGFDVADEPITEGITSWIDAESDNADKYVLQRLLKMAQESVQYI